MLNFNEYDYLSFDCYGTLIDWERGIVAALRPVLARHGVTRSDEEMLNFFGEVESTIQRGSYRPYREVLSATLDGIGDRLGFAPSDEERTAFGGSVEHWPAFPDSAEGLKALSTRFKLVILSNIDDELFAYSAKRLGAEFADVITAQQAGSYKPNRHNFELLLERTGNQPDRLLHVAQSLFHDIAPARALGLTTVWVNRRHDRPGFGATPPASATPDLEVPDLRTLADLATK